ncbi:MAG TPA: hypothetical protein VKR32_04785 [Puia sp.]|nr:hypothetical protein [Puia sp.]
MFPQSLESLRLTFNEIYETPYLTFGSILRVYKVLDTPKSSIRIVSAHYWNPPQELRFIFLTVGVNDLKKSLAFYRVVLGLRTNGFDGLSLIETHTG